MTYHASPLCSEFILFFPRNRKEQGLTELLNAKVPNHHLSFRCDHEVGEGFAADGVDAWAVGGIHFHDRIDVEERPIAFDQHRQAYRTKVNYNLLPLYVTSQDNERSRCREQTSSCQGQGRSGLLRTSEGVRRGNYRG